MRTLVVAPGPSFSVSDVERGWTKAFAKFGEVQVYNLDDRLRFFGGIKFDGKKLTDHEAVRLATEPLGNAIWRFWPDLIFVVSGFFLHDDLWEVLKTRPHKTVLLCTESPYEENVQFQRTIDWEPDLVLLNDPINLMRYRERHNNVWYAPHAYDPEIHKPGRATKKYKSDFGWCGTGYPSRRDFFARVDWRGIDVKLAGNWQIAEGTCLEPFVAHDIRDCFDNTEAVKLYRSCKASANLYRARTNDNEANDPRLTEGYAIGPREVELAATRTFFLREPREEGDELFPFLPTFTEPGEFSDQLRYYLQHDDEREDAARRAQQAIANRTFDAHARRLLQILPD